MTAPFEVWAPRAWRVEVELCDPKQLLLMQPRPDGHFQLDAEQVVGPYQLRVDGGGPIPDPRADDVVSVHGPCFRVDHSQFRWTDGAHRPAPLEGAVIYELHVGTFTAEGTFDGAAMRLPALKALGVTHVELMPVAAFSGQRGWGYDGTALFAVHRPYGGPDGLKRFVDAAHGLGLSVVLDVVHNHLGPEGNYLGQLGPYFAESQTPWGGSVVNLAHPRVRRFFLDNAVHWVRHYHVDALRLDAVHALGDLTFLDDLRTILAPHGTLLIAESDLNDPAVLKSMDAQWSDDFHHALHVALTGETHGYYADFAARPLTQLAHVLAHGFLYQGQHSGYRGRPHGKPLTDVQLHRLLGYAQTHDQIGNEGPGLRLHARAGLDGAKAAMALVMLAPFTPMLFMGEEWAASSPFLFFSDHQDPHVAQATSAARKKDQGQAVDPQSPEAFRRSVLDWDERTRAPHRSMLAYTRMLIALRQHLRGPGKTIVDEEKKTLVYRRGNAAVVLGPAPIPEGTWDVLAEGENFAVLRGIDREPEETDEDPGRER